MYSLVGEPSPDTLLLLYLDLLLLIVCTWSRTLCCADLSSRSDGSASDVSSTSPIERADFKGSGIILSFASPPETGEVQFVKVQLSAPSGCRVSMCLIQGLTHREIELDLPLFTPIWRPKSHSTPFLLLSLIMIPRKPFNYRINCHF